MTTHSKRSKYVLAFALALSLAPACGEDAGRASSEGGSTGPGGSTGGGTGSGSAGSGASTGTPIDPEVVCAALTLDNDVDRAACPDVQGQGIDPKPSDEVELCRRLHIDLLGTSPTQAQFDERCAGKTAAAIVDDFMARPEYVAMGQRVWADELRMTSSLTHYEYIEQIDALVQQLYSGSLKLPEFAVTVATHPGFTGRWDGQDLVGYNFQMFLGRDAAPHERLDLEALWHMWEERFIDAHPTYYYGYSKVVVNTIACMGDQEQACHSDLWGHKSVVIPVVEEGNYDYEGVNVFDLDALTPEQWATLRLPGELIVEQPTFFETAAHKALVRYLGYDAGKLLPDVRQALTDILVATQGDIRAMERELLTSLLYTMASEFPDPEGTLEENGSPPYWHGPMKQLQAESWLDSVEVLTGVELGSCDHRYPQVQGGRPTPDADYMQTVWHPNNYPRNPDFPPDANAPDYSYADLARLLGGCPDQESQQRFTGTGVMIALAQSQIAQYACGEALMAGDALLIPPNVDPADKSEGALAATIDHVHRAAVLRPLPEDLAAAVAAAADGCRDDAACDGTSFLFHYCTSVLKTGSFLFY